MNADRSRARVISRAVSCVSMVALLAAGCGPLAGDETVVVNATVTNVPGTAGGQCGFVEQLANGDVLYAIKFPAAQASVQVFSKKNGVQNIATSIPGFKNADGTFTYRHIVPASTYKAGDKILARFYHFEPNKPGMFTPGPTGTTSLPQFTYGSPACAENVACIDRASTPKYVQQLGNGDMKFSVTLPAPQAYVEVFVQQNGVQNIAQNIVSSGVANPDGTKTYSLVSAASKYKAGDKIIARFYSYKTVAPGIFTPGPTDNVWAPMFVYSQSNACTGVTPKLSCVVDLDAAAGSMNRGHLVALFGYDSSFPADTTIAVGPRNQFVPGADRAQPTVFHPGLHSQEVAVSFDDSGVVWQLDGASAVATKDDLPCSESQTERIRALKQAERTVTMLRSIADTSKREYVSALVLNILNTTNRAFAGLRTNVMERKIGSYIGTVDPTVRPYLQLTGRGLSLIPPEVRAQLLGTMASFDPGDGSQPSDWDDLLQAPISNINPRLRAPSCEMAPSTDVTVGIFDKSQHVDPNEPKNFAADGTPTILGIQRNTVSSPHPALVTDHDTLRSNGPNDEGDGFRMLGVRTNLPCPCDATQGLICSATLDGRTTPPDPTFDRCMAIPIISQGKDFTLRGYNFWDMETPGLVLRPLSGANGTPAIFKGHESGVDTSGGSADCFPATGQFNETHDLATFSTNVSPGFYRMQMFNQNGHFRYRKEDPLAPGRELHVCWKADGVAQPPMGINTNTDCDDTKINWLCAGDGGPCGPGIWPTAPRPLSQCRHSFLSPVVCGETPNWFASEPEPRSQPMVMVQAGDPTFQLRIHRQSVEAAEESGTDFFGEDETQILLAAFSDKDSKNGIPSMDELKRRMSALGPDDYDTGTHRVFNPSLPPTDTKQVLANLNDVGQDEVISMGMEFLEIDCKPCVLATIGLVGAAAIGGVCFFAAPACAGAGAAGGVLVATALAIVASSDVNDNMGTMTWKGSSRDMSTRIFGTHDANFWPNFDPFNPANLSPLPEPVPPGPKFGDITQRLAHPFVTDPNQTKINRGGPFREGTNYPTVQCGRPGQTCPAGQTCIVSRCLPNGTVDGTAGLSYIEHREARANDGDSWYGIDLLYERRQCVPMGTAATSTSTVCE